MQFKAFVQMGSERREAILDVPDDWSDDGDWEEKEVMIEKVVLDWVNRQYGWGWHGGGFDNDFSSMEGSPSHLPAVKAFSRSVRVRPS